VLVKGHTEKPHQKQLDIRCWDIELIKRRKLWLYSAYHPSLLRRVRVFSIRLVREDFDEAVRSGIQTRMVVAVAGVLAHFSRETTRSGSLRSAGSDHHIPCKSRRLAQRARTLTSLWFKFGLLLTSDIPIGSLKRSLKLATYQLLLKQIEFNHCR
jgi:hypothetical protein